MKLITSSLDAIWEVKNTQGLTKAFYFHKLSPIPPPPPISKGNLHPAVSAKSISPQSTLSTENSHLRRLAENILVILGPPNEIQSRAVLVLFREILTCRVLQPVLEMFSDPDYWNQTIESLVGEIYSHHIL